MRESVRGRGVGTFTSDYGGGSADQARGFCGGGGGGL